MAIVLPLVGQIAVVSVICIAVAVANLGSGATRAEVVASMMARWRSVAALVMASLFLCAALLGARLSKRGVVARLKLGRTEATVLELALGSIGAVAANAATNSAIHYLPLSQDLVEAVRDERQLREAALTSHGIGWSIVTVALFVIIGPIAEELFFRGYVQTRLCERWGPFAGIAITSVAFGFYHLPAQAVFAVVFGAYVGWVAYSGGGTRPAILAHVVNNAVATVELWSASHTVPSAGSGVTSDAVLASEAIVAAACIAGMLAVRAHRGAARPHHVDRGTTP